MRIGLLITLAILLTATVVVSEEDLATEVERVAAEVTRLDETVVTPARGPREFSKQTFTVEIVPEVDMSGAGAGRSVQDVLDKLPTVMMQRTAPGQGSPYIRGLTGIRNLTLIDGIRLNNSTWRSGPNQYLATVDNFSLSRAEVVFGPGSVLYGSDSLGGTINLLPLRPDMVDGRYCWGGRVLARVATAEESGISRFEGQGGDENVGFLAGVTRKMFGDLHSGDGRNPYTGYDEWNGDFRFLWNVGERVLLTIGFQYVNHDGVPRTHKTIYGRPWKGTSKGNELKRELDHERTLLYVRGEMTDPFSFMQHLAATVSWHKQCEERYRVKSSGSADRQSVDVSTLGLLLSCVSEVDFGTFTYGFDGYLDFVDSAKKKYDDQGNLTGEGIQGPVADDSEYTMLGLYVQGEFPIVHEFVIVAGLRGNWIEADVGRMEDPETGGPTSFTESWSGLVGSLRFRWDVSDPVGLFGGVSQGFRAPNLSDLTRLDSARSNEFEIPSPGLDPETALSFELGARFRLPGTWVTLSVFNTLLSDMILRVPTGEEVDGEYLVTKENIGDGFVRGIELSGDVALGSGFALFGGATWMNGEADTYPTSERVKEREYLDRLPPLMGSLGVRWVSDSGLFAMARVRAAAKADRLSTRDESDTQRIPPGGTSGYVVLDLETRIPLTDGATATVGLENLFDEDYRIHGSGTNMPGRNFHLSVEFRF